MLSYSAEEAVANGWSFPHLRVLQKASGDLEEVKCFEEAIH